MEKVIGPYVFEETRGQPITFNGDCYRGLIRNFVILDLRENGMDGYWFQQDGAISTQNAKQWTY